MSLNIKTLDIDMKQTTDRGLPHGYLSPSQVNLFFICPKAYEYSYILNKRYVASIEAIQGSALHHSAEIVLQTKIDFDTLLTEEDATDLFSDKFNINTDKNKDDLKNINIGKSKDQGIILTSTYYKDRVIKIDPIAVETSFHLEMGGIPVHGRIDIQEKTTQGDIVTDIKVCKTKKSQDFTDKSLQLTTYSAATGIETVRFDSVIKNKTPKIIVTDSKRNVTDINNSIVIYQKIADAIKSGSFPPCDPTSWKCSEKFCSFYDICKK